MAYKTWGTKANFDAHYDISGEPEGHPNTRPEIRLHYHRKVLLPWFRRHMPDLIRVLGLQPSHRIVIVGVAFGWSMEVLQALGFNNVIGTDTSSYIQSAKTTNEDVELRSYAIQSVSLDDADVAVTRLRDDTGPRSKLAAKILNENIANNSSRGRVRTALGGTPDWVISEGVLESLTNAEATALASNMRALGGQVAHRITYPTEPAGEYNQNTPAQWKALLGTDKIVHVQTWTVL